MAAQNELSAAACLRTGAVSSPIHSYGSRFSVNAFKSLGQLSGRARWAWLPLIGVYVVM
jgi:hypothetical protein